MSRLFIPKTECTVGDGGCFREGRCLRQCRPRLSLQQQMDALRTEVRALRKLVTRR